MYGAFEQCRGLRAITAPAGCKLAVIGERAFRYCCALTTVPSFEHVMLICRYAFAHCWLLEAVHLSPKLRNIPQGTFSHCHGLRDVTFGDATNFIGYNAFFHCKSLKWVALEHTNVGTIGNKAFEGCRALAGVTLPVTAETCLRYRAFANCSSLEHVRLSALTRSVGFQAFWQCRSLKKIVLNRFSTSTGMQSLADWSIGDAGAYQNVKIVAPKATLQTLGVPTSANGSADLLQYYWSLKLHRKGCLKTARPCILQAILGVNRVSNQFEISPLPPELYCLIFSFLEVYAFAV